MDVLFSRFSNYKDCNFQTDKNLIDDFKSIAKILVVGSGGLGCEILKNLALSEVKNIYVIDLDTIELSNLNRQFLFRDKDIGKFKCEIAANYIKDRFNDIDIKYSSKNIQEIKIESIKQFNIIIGGLDNMEARMYINKLVHDLVNFDEEGNIIEETIIPFIDGGTEGFRGQSRVIIPFKSSCLNCTKNLDTKRTYPLCTLAERPRLPEHCIAYVSNIEWKKVYNKVIDTENKEDIEWICSKAEERADKFNIKGVDRDLTVGFLKNVVPAIASTNSLIAAETVLEALKLLVGYSKPLDNYFMYMGHQGLYASHDKYDKDINCYVCREPFIRFITSKNKNEYNNNLLVRNIDSYKIEDLLNEIKKQYSLNDPSINYKNKYIYAGGNLAESYKNILKYTFKDLISKNLIQTNKTENNTILLEVLDLNLKEMIVLRIYINE